MKYTPYTVNVIQQYFQMRLEKKSLIFVFQWKKGVTVPLIPQDKTVSPAIAPCASAMMRLVTWPAECCHGYDRGAGWRRGRERGGTERRLWGGRQWLVVAAGGRLDCSGTWLGHTRGEIPMYSSVCVCMCEKWRHVQLQQSADIHRPWQPAADQLLQLSFSQDK